MPLNPDEVKRVRSGMPDETAGLTDEQVASGAAETMVQQAKAIREQGSAADAARNLISEKDTQIRDLEAKQPKPADPAIQAEWVKVKSAGVEHLVTTAKITAGQGEALVAALKADPGAMLAPAAGGTTPFDAAVKVLEMNVVGGVRADGKTQTGQQNTGSVLARTEPGGNADLAAAEQQAQASAERYAATKRGGAPT